MGTIALVPYNSVVEPEIEASSANGDVASLQRDLDQFHPLKRITLHDEVDAALLRSDPFFLLASILQTSLLSWAQLLNVLKEVIRGGEHTEELSNEDLRYDLDQLRYHIGIVHRAKELVSETLELVRQGGCASWPKPNFEEQQTRKGVIQRQLERDCMNITDRCSFMIADYESATAVLVGFAQLKASERQMTQAKEVHSLTKLATLFLPLSFTATIYGMNISQWQPALSLFWFLGTSAVFLILTFLYLYKSWWLDNIRDVWVFLRGQSRKRRGKAV